jgi:hypothetical protein
MTTCVDISTKAGNGIAELRRTDVLMSYPVSQILGFMVRIHKSD